MITSQSQTAGCKIWVDADACPKVIKEILYRVADRVPVMVTLVANQAPQVPRSPYIHTVQVPSGYDVADHHIVEKSNPGDLVVTADIPLAAELIGQGCIALNPQRKHSTAIEYARFLRFAAKQWHTHGWPVVDQSV